MRMHYKLIWVVVANASNARLFRSAQEGKALVEIETLAHPASRVPRQALTSDAAGSAFKSAGGGWHESGAEQETKQHELDAFAIQIARRLEQGRTAKEFELLALVAAPALLGALRAHLDAPTSALVRLALDKNMVHSTPADILAALPPLFLSRD